jgi:hypothetical protein
MYGQALCLQRNTAVNKKLLGCLVTIVYFPEVSYNILWDHHMIYIVMKGDMCMNTYYNISGELKAYFSNNSIFKILLPIDMVFLFAGLAIILLSGVFGIYLGDFISGLAFWSFILGLLLTYANLHQQFLYIGLFGYGVINLFWLLRDIFKYHNFGWSSLFYAIVFAGLGFLVFKRSISGNN